MNYELLLAARMACGNTVVERELREDYLAAIVDSYGSTNGTSTAETWVDADDIATEIDAVVAERENFEHGEVPPSDEAVHVMKQILHAAEGLGAQFPQTSVSTYYGELDATWERENRMLRVIAYSDGRAPILYFCADQGEPLTRGQTIRPASAQQLSEKLKWLIG